MRAISAPQSGWGSWVICGAESGPGARYMHPTWARDLRDQCKKADVPFFFKKASAHGEVAGSGSFPDLYAAREFPAGYMKKA